MLLAGLNGGELWRPMITRSREAERIIGGFVLGEINTDMGDGRVGGVRAEQQPKRFKSQLAGDQV